MQTAESWSLVADVYSFQFAFTDAVGDQYAWNIVSPRTLSLEFFEIDGFGLDFHLKPDNEADLLVDWGLHDGYSFVGDSRVQNRFKGTPEYHSNFQGINFAGRWEEAAVPEPATGLLFGAGFVLLAMMRRPVKVH